MQAARLLPFLLACAGAALLPAPPAASGPDQFLPDLKPRRSMLKEHFLINRITTRELRFSTEIVNVGEGPLEIRGRRDAPGEPMLAVQAIYGRKGELLQELPIGEFVYHPEHAHWHLAEVAVYRLRDRHGDEVVQGRKISFCLRDDFRRQRKLKRSPASPQYSDCPRGTDLLSITSGLSVGWADIYRYHLPDQSLDVTHLPPGKYFLEVELNPEGVLFEARRSNNVTSLEIRL